MGTSVAPRRNGLAATLAMVARGVTRVNLLYALNLQRRRPASVREVGRELSRQAPGLGRLSAALR